MGKAAGGWLITWMMAIAEGMRLTSLEQFIGQIA